MYKIFIAINEIIDKQQYMTLPLTPVTNLAVAACNEVFSLG